MAPIDDKALREAVNVTKGMQPATSRYAGDYDVVTVVEYEPIIRAALEAYEAAKPEAADGLKLGSRLTVEGVEAAVVAKATIEAHEKLIAELRSSIDALLDDRERRAMLSAAGDGK